MVALSASTVTVAIWPTLTLPISDSLRGTTSCIVLRSLRTANAELEELDAAEELDELEAPVALRPLAPVAPAPLAPDPLEELLELEALVVPLPDTTSPTCPDSETIVPLSGAYRLVSWTACSSLCTVSVSLLTAALAEARFASRVAVLIVAFVVEEPELLSLLLVSRSDVAPLLGEVLAGVVVVRVLEVGEVVLGVVLVGVVAVGVVALGVVVLGVVLVGVVVAGVVLAGAVVVFVGTE